MPKVNLPPVTGCAAALGLLMAAGAARDAEAQSVQAKDGSVAIGGNASNVSIGVNPRDLPRIVAAAARPHAQRSKEDREQISKLSREIGARDEQMKIFLQMLGHQDVPESKRWEVLLAIVVEYKGLRDKVAQLPPDDPVTESAVAALADVQLQKAGDLAQLGELRRQLTQQVKFEIAEDRTVRFSDGWDKDNIVSVLVPQLRGLKGAPASGEVRVHKMAAEPLRRAFAELADRGLLANVTQWCGSFAPRALPYGPRILSAHALGLSFDLNCGSRSPALLGEQLGPVADILRKHGFYWGGRYRRPDYFHFQYLGPAEAGPQAGETI